MSVVFFCFLGLPNAVSGKRCASGRWFRRRIRFFVACPSRFLKAYAMQGTRPKHRRYQHAAIDLSERSLSRHCVLFPRPSIGTLSSSHAPFVALLPPRRLLLLRVRRGTSRHRGPHRFSRSSSWDDVSSSSNSSAPAPRAMFRCVPLKRQRPGRGRVAARVKCLAPSERTISLRTSKRRSAHVSQAESRPRSMFRAASANQQTAVTAGRASSRALLTNPRPAPVCSSVRVSAFLLPKSTQVQCRLECAEPGRELRRQLV